MEMQPAAAASCSLQTPDWLAFLRLVCAFAEGAAALQRKPVFETAAAVCVVAVLDDPQRRIAVMGGRAGMPRSLGSVYGGAVTRFLSGFRGRFTRTVATPSVQSIGNGIAVCRDGLTVLVTDCTGGSHAVHIVSVRTGACVRTIGGWGTGPLQFEFPTQVWVASDGFVFVADFGNGRIQILTPQFDFHTFGGAGQLNEPCGVCANNDVIFVSEQAAHRVSVFGRGSGTLLRRFGNQGSCDGELCDPRGLCIMSDRQNIAVADCGNSRISVWSLEGDFVRHVGVGQLESPMGVACSDADELVVADCKKCVWVFSASGEVLWTRAIRCCTGVMMHGSAIYGQSCTDGKCYVLT